MGTFLKIIFLVLITPIATWGVPPSTDFFKIGKKEIQENDVVFKYSSADGSVELKCTHVFDSPDLNDWDVWCGKGTKMLRQFRVHFLVRQYQSRSAQRSAFEVLYWVTDRNQHITKAFSSTSTWIQFKNLSDLETMSFSQGVENDYAFLKLEFTPQNRN